MTAPNGYLLYEWSNGDTTQILETAVSGFYAAVYQDALGMPWHNRSCSNYRCGRINARNPNRK
ncbi:MAG: hypothetical protein IPO26_20175 [Saprospiraceae bacterium]|nr:hypothetical protein [Saprospiraceae bacterium]